MHAARVPFQRRHALTGRHVPHLELLARPRNDAPPVQKHGNAIDLRRRQIVTKVQWTPRRTPLECPSSVATHLLVATSQTLSVLSYDADTTRRPSGNTATPRTYDEDTSRSTVDAAHRTQSECPSSVATHLPVATSHTLSVLSRDPDRSRGPPPRTARSVPFLFGIGATGAEIASIYTFASVWIPRRGAARASVGSARVAATASIAGSATMRSRRAAELPFMGE